MIEKKLFIGGMNRDDAYSILPAEDYTEAYNIRITDDRNNNGLGKIKPVEGNQLVASPLPEGNFQVIGTCEDKENDIVYYFVTGDKDYILKYDGDCTILLDGDNVTGGLGFGNRIHSAVLVNDTIYWTDNDNQPRAYNLNRTYTLPIRQEDITLIKRGPKYAPEAGKIDSSTSDLIEELTNNFIDGNSYQFAYRYVYNEYQYSVLSPFSKLITHNRDDENYDAIAVYVPTKEQIPNGVRKVDLLVRNGNSGSFYLWDAIDTGFEDHNDQIQSIGRIFKNDSKGIPVADEKAYKLFDNVPLKSETIEAARNRLFLGNNLIGYDPVSVVMEASAQLDSIGPSATIGEYILVEVIWEEQDDFFPDRTNEFREFYLVVKISEGANAGYYQVSGQNASNLFYSQSLPETIPVAEDDFILAVDGDLEGFYVDNYIPDGVDNGRVATNFTYRGTPPVVTGVGSDIPHESISIFKSDSWYRIGIVFYDNEGRSAGVSPDTIVVRTDERSYLTSQFNTVINWSILSDASIIPDWATHYQIVRTKNQSTSFFVQSYVYSVKYVQIDDSGNYTLNDLYNAQKTTGLAFDLSNMYRDGIGYSFQDGDLLRYCPSDESGNILLKVIDTYGSWIITDYVGLGNLADDSANLKAKCLVEIFTPYQSSENEFFYEVGEAYPITDGDFSVRSGYITGDTYLVEREFDETELLAEAMNRNDKYWTLWHTDNGRTSVVIRDDGQKRLPTNIAYSNTFIQGSKINGLNSFELLDNTDLDEQNGEIKKLVLTSKTQQYGSVMLAICAHETASIYLGETQVVDNAGNAILATSGNVIGTVNNLKGSYGTRNPESVAENEGNVYWVDTRNGKVIRYSNNGLMPISDYKMSAWWKRATEVYSGEWVAGYDDFHDEYIINIPGNVNSIVFSEELTRWTSFYTYSPEAFSMRGLTLISFKDGNLYTHNNSLYGYFYSGAVDPKIKFVANESYSYMRKYTYFHLEGTVTPTIAEFATSEPYSQYTSTLNTEASTKEGIVYIPIFRDENSPNTTGTADDRRYKGDFMEGRFLVVTLTFPQFVFFSVYSMGIKSIENYGHNVVYKNEI